MNELNTNSATATAEKKVVEAPKGKPTIVQPEKAEAKTQKSKGNKTEDQLPFPLDKIERLTKKILLENQKKGGKIFIKDLVTSATFGTKTVKDKNTGKEREVKVVDKITYTDLLHPSMKAFAQGNEGKGRALAFPTLGELCERWAKHVCASQLPHKAKRLQYFGGDTGEVYELIDDLQKDIDEIEPKRVDLHMATDPEEEKALRLEIGKLTKGVEQKANDASWKAEGLIKKAKKEARKQEQEARRGMANALERMGYSEKPVQRRRKGKSTPKTGRQKVAKPAQNNNKKGKQKAS